MAKYDDKRTRSDSNTYEKRGTDIFDQNRAGVTAQGAQFQGDYGRAQASDAGMRDEARAGFSNFAQTGGFSPNDVSAMRARGTSPIRAAYANAERNINRQQSMGGTSAGKSTLMARMAREQGQAASDATTNVDAGIAQMRQQGKLAGNQGIANLYGTTPGQTALQSRNVLENTGQQLDLQNMEQNRMQGLLNTQAGLTQAPGSADRTIGQIGQVADIGRKIFKPGA